MSNDFELPEGWYRDGWIILDAQGVAIARISAGGNGDPVRWRESAARLIAAAPAMLAALEDNLMAWEGEEDSVQREHRKLISELRDVIAQAKGE